MKKIRLSIAALMTAFLILSVTACGSASDSGTETTSGSRQTTTAEDTRSSGEIRQKPPIGMGMTTVSLMM